MPDNTNDKFEDDTLFSEEDIEDVEDTENLDNIDIETVEEQFVSSDTIGLYFKNISSFKPLTLSQEIELGKLIKQGDQQALKKLILSNLRFVVSIANKYKNTGVPIADLVNQGNIGLLEAAKRYDPERGVKFITYAVWWIRQAIIQGLTEQTGAVRLPIKQANSLYKINSAVERLTKTLKRTPTMHEVTEATEINENDINDILRASRTDLSLDAPMNDGEDKSFLDNLEANTPDAEEEIIQRTLKASIDEIVADLDEREANIILQRFGLDGGDVKTLEEIGSELNISRERVRQIEAKAMSKLRKKALKKRLNDYLN